ncbi:uncharacterized protein SPSK_04758 [Sporothrix schenckii 1099-18]|uniref:Uncharacterized protein n=1 Tax=Sporothrix schenckii 1099-18 TaxID=1397361 RepID=A0A0F2M140_SPOSC|nr:uncharacterized protein SPSK_04758 [Sporothrix schenckii 1099-18]KJR83427.1 hypothetical protein SPSK_04758 [Sporothrix schenckii 1099-18]
MLPARQDEKIWARKVEGPPVTVVLRTTFAVEETDNEMSEGCCCDEKRETVVGSVRVKPWSPGRSSGDDGQ